MNFVIANQSAADPGLRQLISGKPVPLSVQPGGLEPFQKNCRRGERRPFLPSPQIPRPPGATAFNFGGQNQDF